VSQCKTETLFNNVFKVDFLSKGAPQPACLRKKENQLITFVDNYLQSRDMMSSTEYHKWRNEGIAQIESKPTGEKNLGNEEKKKRQQDKERFYGMDHQYKKVMEVAKKEWMLSMDGVVTALWYDPKEKQYMAKIGYKKRKVPYLFRRR
jgi:hypothetical protein